MKYIFLTLLSGFIFSQNIVLESARMAQQVYQETPQTEFRLLHDHTHHFWGNRLMAFHDAKTDTIYVSVRGTSKIQNWLANAHIGTAEKALNTVFDLITQRPEHKGHYKLAKEATGLWFILAFENLKDEVESILQQNPHTQVIFTGHSYGGIMANLLAQHAYHRYPNLKFKCYTFNAPGSLEIRQNSLKMPKIPEEILTKRFFNHVRITDPVSYIGTHESKKIAYDGPINPLAAHAIGYFVEDLDTGMQPI
jgi:hypothetical protein